MARRRCRIDFERSVSGDGNSSVIMSNDLSRLIEKESNEIKEEQEDTESETQGNNLIFRKHECHIHLIIL